MVLGNIACRGTTMRRYTLLRRLRRLMRSWYYKYFGVKGQNVSMRKMNAVSLLHLCGLCSHAL